MKSFVRPFLALATMSTLAAATAFAQSTIYTTADSAPFAYTTFTGTFVGTGTDTLTFQTYQLPSFYLLDNIVIPGVTLVNPSFETGDFTGFTQTGDLSFTGVQSGDFHGTDPTDGDYQAYFGSVGTYGFTSQTFTDVSGQTYGVSFDLADLFFGPSSFCVYVDGPSNPCAVSGQPPAGSVTPEPSSLVLLGTGALSLAAATRRKLLKA